MKTLNVEKNIESKVEKTNIPYQKALDKKEKNKIGTILIFDKNGIPIAKAMNRMKSQLNVEWYKNYHLITCEVTKNKIKCGKRNMHDMLSDFIIAICDSKILFSSLTLYDLSKVTCLDEFNICYYNNKNELVNSYKFNSNNNDLIKII